MRKTCEHCGQGFDAERSDARFCGSTCRGRSFRGEPSVLATVGRDGANAQVASLATQDDGEEPKRPRYRQRRRLIADEVEDRLRAAGLLDHWQSATVLDLADSLDWTGGSLSARAAAHRELERQMVELLRGTDERGSAVGGYRNELAERRARRAGGAS